MQRVPESRSAQLDALLATLGNRLGAPISTLPTLLAARCERSPHASALLSNDAGRGEWQSTRWSKYRDSVAHLAAALRKLGLEPEARVGLMARSSQRWDVTQMGILSAQGVVVGLDPHDLDDNLNAVARRCDLAGLIVEDQSWLTRFGSGVRDRLRFVVHFGPSDETDTSIAYEPLLESDGSQTECNWGLAQADDPATIIFTSGTTGAPKGIQYTHRQLCSAVASILEAFPDVNENSHLACWLPLSNLFQRMINLLAIASGAQTYYVEDPRTIMQHVGSIEPHLFIGVPRFYEKLYAGFMERIEQRGALQRSLVRWAFGVGERHMASVRRSRKPSVPIRLCYPLADRLVFRRLRSVMGSNLRYMVSGSAPMPVWLLERFHAIGFLILEAYGMSENAIPVAANRPDAFRFGTVGRPMSGCQIRLAKDGELLVRGPGVISSYYGEDQTKLLDADGYLASGDYATMDSDGFITLTGRKSEIIKTATGRRIAPAAIESFVSKVPSVEHAAVFGANRPFLVGVISVSPQAVEAGVRQDPEAMGLVAYCERLRADFARCLAPLPAYRRPVGLVVTTCPFSVEAGELTTNLKLRRRNIEARYADQLEALYWRLQRTEDRPFADVVQDTRSVVLCNL